MAVTSAKIDSSSEFSLANRFVGDSRGPVRWIFSHAARHWVLWIVNIGGALVNAALASIGPFIIGQAFNAISAAPPQVNQLPRLALLMAGLQLLRGLSQYLALQVLGLSGLLTHFRYLQVFSLQSFAPD